MTGQIVKLVDGKYFGFIRSDIRAGQNEYFFHRDDLMIDWDSLCIGKDVEFEEARTPKGLRRLKNVREG